jgi:O-acetylhomoserine (thiol)-lyase
MSNNNNYHFDTLKIRAGYNSAEHNGATQVPIYQTAAFDLYTVEHAQRILNQEEPGYLYSRLQNPTIAALESRVAQLEGATAAVAVASGMAAVSYALLNVGEGGSVIVAAEVYGGTYDAYKRLYPKLGVQVDIVNEINNLSLIRSLIKDDTKAIFIESISNPLNTIADIQALADLAHEHGLPLIVDNTLATPYLLNPFKFGADVVVYSATKALSGQGAVLGGLILESGKFDWASGRHPQFSEKIYPLGNRSALEVFPNSPFTFRVKINYCRLLGAALSPFSAYLLLLGIETLSERVQKQSDSALKIALFLNNHPKVEWVSHPALESNGQLALYNKYFPIGAGGVFAIKLKGDKATTDKFIEALQLFSYQANIGDARSLIIDPANTTHRELTGEEQLAVHLESGIIRLSIGLEYADDLINDLKQVLDTL